jgi:glycosyltransferase involved in cell wall biosynthesis
MSRLDAVHVVVPARDEEGLIGRCLESLSAARGELRAGRPDLSVRITVVLDRCIDGTAEIVERAAGMQALPVTALSVGAARAAGVQYAAHVHASASQRTERVWVACTDADSAPSPAWLVGQVRCAEAGYAARIGTVLPDLQETEPLLRQRWLDRHHGHVGHPHVHGANLGFSLAAYLQVGGFTHQECGEDVDLVSRLRRAGLVVLATADDPVATSGRRTSRVRGGFADYLGDLDDELADVN